MTQPLRSDAAPSEDTRFEALSCLRDGELDDTRCAAILAGLRDDPEARRRWSLMNAACDALQSSDVGVWHSDGFSDRMRTALEHEPAILAPAQLSGRPAWRRWLLSGAGIAALGALAFIGTRQIGAPSSEPPAVKVVRQQQEPAAPVVIEPTTGIARVESMERYLTAHRELSRPGLMPEAMPYLRTSTALPMQAGAR